MRVNFRYSIPYDAMLTSMMGNKYNKKQEYDIKAYINALEKRWKSEEGKITREIEKVSGLRFKRNVDCYIVKDMFFEGISHPLTLRMVKDFDIVKSNLIHELIHILFVQNGDKILNVLNHDYLNERRDFKIHMPVLLVERKVVENLFGKKFFERVLNREKDYDNLGEIWIRANKVYAKFDKNILKFLKDVGK